MFVEYDIDIDEGEKLFLNMDSVEKIHLKDKKVVIGMFNGKEKIINKKTKELATEVYTIYKGLAEKAIEEKQNINIVINLDGEELTRKTIENIENLNDIYNR